MASDRHVLFLDDMIDRHKSFRNSAPSDGMMVVYVYNARSAIQTLDGLHPIQAFLDHDLSEEDTMSVPGLPTHKPTGMVVVEHILTMSDPPLDVIIHSCNGPAAELMEKRLKEHPAGIRVRRIPFPYLIHTLNEAKKRSDQ